MLGQPGGHWSPALDRFRQMGIQPPWRELAPCCLLAGLQSSGQYLEKSLGSRGFPVTGAYLREPAPGQAWV